MPEPSLVGDNFPTGSLLPKRWSHFFLDRSGTRRHIGDRHILHHHPPGFISCRRCRRCKLVRTKQTKNRNKRSHFSDLLQIRKLDSMSVSVCGHTIGSYIHKTNKKKPTTSTYLTRKYISSARVTAFAHNLKNPIRPATPSPLRVH